MMIDITSITVIAIVGLLFVLLILYKVRRVFLKPEDLGRLPNFDATPRIPRYADSGLSGNVITEKAERIEDDYHVINISLLIFL